MLAKGNLGVPGWDSPAIISNMERHHSHTITVRSAQRHELAHLYSTDPNGHSNADRHRPDQKFIEAALQGGVRPEELLLAWEEGEVVGMGLIRVTTGRLAAVWPPSVMRSSRPDQVARVLAEAYLQRLQHWGIQVAQLLLSPWDRKQAEPLLKIGFRWITELDHFSRSLVPGVSCSTERDRNCLRLVLSDEKDPRFSSLLGQTYVGSRDCPELNEWRSLSDVLDDYATMATGGLSRWWLLVADDQPVGVALFISVPESTTAELVYFGLIPEARGKGLATAALRAIIDWATKEKFSAILLAVDRRNDPARTLYLREDFQFLDRDDVYLWTPDPGVA